MQHKTAWNFAPPGSNRLRELLKPGGTNRLRELLKLYRCEDVVTPVDEDAFGRRSSELIQARFGKIANASNTKMNTRRKRKTSSEFVRLQNQAPNSARAMLPPQRLSTKQRSLPRARKQRGSKNFV
jgi:hypothetical protein